MALPTSILTDFNRSGRIEGKPKDLPAGIYTPTAIQYFPLGTRFEDHGREWVYCRAHEAITLPHRGSPCLAQYPWVATSVYSVKGEETDSRSVGDAGRKSITVEFIDDYLTDSAPYMAKNKNSLAGGFATIFFTSELIATVRITGNEVAIADPDTATNDQMVIYFDDPLPTAIDASAHVDIYPSPYIACGNSNSGTVYSSFVCVPPCAVTSQYFFWGQVKGPCWVTPNAGITTAKYRDVGFHTNGTIVVMVAGYQRAGYIIYRGDGSQDDAMIMLDI
jgi:hypothetical protein